MREIMETKQPTAEGLIVKTILIVICLIGVIAFSWKLYHDNSDIRTLREHEQKWQKERDKQ